MAAVFMPVNTMNFPANPVQNAMLKAAVVSRLPAWERAALTLKSVEMVPAEYLVRLSLVREAKPASVMFVWISART